MPTYARRTSRSASQTRVWTFECEDMCTEAWRWQCEQQRPQQARSSSARHIGMSRARQHPPRYRRFKCAHTLRHAAYVRTAAATTRCVCISIRQHTLHTSAYVSIYAFSSCHDEVRRAGVCCMCGGVAHLFGSVNSLPLLLSACSYVSAYVSIRRIR